MKKVFFNKAVMVLCAVMLCAGCSDKNTASVNEEIISRLDAIEQGLNDLAKEPSSEEGTENGLRTYKGYEAGDLIAPEDLNYTVKTVGGYIYIQIKNEEKEYMPAIIITGILYKDNEIVGFFDAASDMTYGGKTAIAKGRLPLDEYGNVVEYDSYEIQFKLGKEMLLEDVDLAQIEAVVVPSSDTLLMVLVKNNGDQYIDSMVIELQFYLNDELYDIVHMWGYDIPAGGFQYLGMTGCSDAYYNPMPIERYEVEVLYAQKYPENGREGMSYE